MAKFRYRMQNILNVKEKLENQARNEFAVAAAVLKEEEDKLEELRNRKTSCENELKRLYEDKLKLIDIRETQDAIEVMKGYIVQQQKNVYAAMQQLEIARQKLTVAMQERKTHDKLKEKQFEAFVAEEAAKESKEIDELVSFRHGEE